MAGYRKRKMIRKRKRSKRRQGVGAKMMSGVSQQSVAWRCTDVQPFTLYPNNGIVARTYGLVVINLLNSTPALLNPRWTPVGPIQNGNAL